jgi:hypothetical protein
VQWRERRSEMLPVVQQPAGQTGSQSDDEQAALARRLRRRNRLLVGAGVLSFLVCIPLVSLPDGTALSVIGLCLATVAGACVISLVYLLAGEGEQGDPERDPEE